MNKAHRKPANPTKESAMSAGIDYGLSSTNIDRETGIRFGVISQGSAQQIARMEV